MAEPQTEVMEDKAASNVDGSYIEQLKAEQNSLSPEFVHASRLLQQEIDRVEGRGPVQDMQAVRLTEKVFIPEKEHPGFNFVGRLLGPRGYTLKRMQAETGCRMTILGRGSMRDKEEEENLRTSENPKFEHLNEALHVFVEGEGPRAIAEAKLAAGVAELRKMMIPGPMAEQMKDMQLRELAMLKGTLREPRMPVRGPPGAGPSRPPMRMGPPPMRRSRPSNGAGPNPTDGVYGSGYGGDLVGVGGGDDVYFERDVGVSNYSAPEDWTSDVIASAGSGQGLKIPAQRIQPKKTYRDHPYAY